MPNHEKLKSQKMTHPIMHMVYTESSTARDCERLSSFQVIWWVVVVGWGGGLRGGLGWGGGLRDG